VKRKRIVPVVAALPGKSRPNAWAPSPLATVTTALREVEPPGPTHARLNVLSAAVSAPVLAEPEVGLVPLHAPLASQEVASTADHVNDDDPPLGTEVGLADSVTVGAEVGGGDGPGVGLGVGVGVGAGVGEGEGDGGSLADCATGWSPEPLLLQAASSAAHRTGQMRDFTRPA